MTDNTINTPENIDSTSKDNPKAGAPKVNVKVVEVPEISIADVNTPIVTPSGQNALKKGFPWIPAVIASVAVVVVALVLIFVFSPIGKSSSTGFGDFKAVSSVKVKVNSDQSKAPDVDLGSLSSLNNLKIASGDVLAKGSGDTVKAGDKVQLNYTMYAYGANQTGAASAAPQTGAASWTNEGNSWDQGEAFPLTVTEPKPSDDSFESVASGQSATASATGNELQSNLNKMVYDQKVGAVLGYFMPAQTSAQGQSPSQFIVFVIDAIGETASTAPKVSHDVPQNAPSIKFDGDKPAGIDVPSGFESTDDIIVNVLKDSDGQEITATDTVKVDYAGYLLDGTEFDSSFKSGKPSEFALNRVVPGWKYGLQGVKVGSKVEILVPSRYGYGAQGSTDQQGNVVIPPNAYLVFYVDVLGISDPATAAGAGAAGDEE